MSVFIIFFARMWRGTVSNALFMSIVISTVRFGGFWLKPSNMFCVRFVSSVVVECCCLKPCWIGEVGS